MKRLLYFACSVCLLGLLFISCNKEDLALEPQPPEDELEARQSAGLLPDLVIQAYGSDISSTTTSCGPTLPNVSCAGGDRQWTAIVSVANIGPGDLFPGTFIIRWVDLTTGSVQDQTVNHNGIRSGSSLRVSRPYFMGPCDCPPPINFFIHSFIAGVDINNQVPETNEGNNRSPQFDTCDGC